MELREQAGQIVPFTIPITVKLADVTPLVFIWVFKCKIGFYSGSPFGQSLGSRVKGDDFCHCLKWTETDSTFYKDGGCLVGVPAIPFVVGPPRFSSGFRGLQQSQTGPEPEIVQ